MEPESKTITLQVLGNDTFIVKPDPAELCRLCANTDNQLIPIFKGEGLEHNIPSKLEKHLPIVKITETDKLPLQVCYQCASTLIAWHNLYEGCSVADKRLREILAVDEKLYHDEETFEDYGDDFRDDDFDQPHADFVQLNTASTSSQSGLGPNTSISEITQLGSSNTFDETENNNLADERYAASQTHCEHTARSVESGGGGGGSGGDGDLPRSSMLDDRCHQRSDNARFVATATSEPTDVASPCQCAMDANGGVKCSSCLKRDNLRCNFCPMVFLNKHDIGRHLRTSHAELYTHKVPAKRVTAAFLLKSKSSRTKRTAAIAKSGQQPLKITISKSSARIVGADGDGAADVPNGDESHLHQCKICLKVCLSLRGLTRHSAVHKNEQPPAVTCDFCAQSFSSNEVKRKHVSEYHRIDVAADGDLRTAAEPMCAVMFKNEPVEQQQLVDENSVPYEPEDRLKVETEEVMLDSVIMDGSPNVHKPDTVKSEAFVCPECSKSFDKKGSLVRHQNTMHNASNEFACDLCERRFATEKLLKRHKSSGHRVKRVKLTDEEDPFSKWYVFADGQKHLKCDQCKYNSLWYHKGRFLEHYRIHTGEKPFTCDLCGKQFRTKTLLQKHVMFVHEGIKEHPCDICGRRFSDKRYMEDHRRIHTGERPYVCDLCGKTFKQSASLFIHKELHKGLRKHACEMCGKRFTTRSSLTIHIKRHVGERNFVCATCGKAFVDGKHLKDHMAVHSEERPFSCELCGGRFKLMKHLKQHGRTHKRDYAA